MTRPADYAVVVGCLMACAFLAGRGIGADQARDQIATVCEPQPGSVLVSVVQDRSGVTCNYIANITGRAPRKAIRL